MKQGKRLDSQIVRAKDNLKMIHSGPSYRQVLLTNPPNKALRQSRHWFWDLTLRRELNEEIIAIKSNWV